MYLVNINKNNDDNRPLNELIQSTVGNKQIKTVHLGNDCTIIIFE